MISKSDANASTRFRMGMTGAPGGDALSGVGEGSRPMGASSTSFAGQGAMEFDAMNNAPNMTMGTNNDTKTSDNEAFLAYMSKAEAGEDDDE